MIEFKQINIYYIWNFFSNFLHYMYIVNKSRRKTTSSIIASWICSNNSIFSKRINAG